MTSPALVSSNLFDDFGIEYEEAYGHDPGLIDFVKLALETISEKASVLDIGCGMGKPVASIITASGRKVYSIDISSTMVILSRKHVPQDFFENISMFDFQPKASESFDAVFASLCFLNLDRDLLAPLLKKISHWMVPEGYLFIGTMVAEDFSAESALDSEDEYGGSHIPTRFMGKNAATLICPKEGWALMLQQAGFEVLQSMKAAFRRLQKLIVILKHTIIL